MRIDGFERAELSVQKLADHFAEPGVVLREAGGKDGVAARFEGQRQEFNLRTLATAVDAFDSDQFSRKGHRRISVARHERTGTTLEGQSNRRDSALQCCAC